MVVYIDGKRISLSPKKSIGKGGEADVYNIGKGFAVKVFKKPSHPDYKGMENEKKSAEIRIKEHQNKLPDFPKNLPEKIIKPHKLAYDKDNKIVGYTMPFIQDAFVLRKFSDKGFRLSGISNNKVIEIFKKIYKTLTETHSQNVIFGDFNDLNVLIKNDEPYFIDADSYQFGKYLCKVFTTRFVDPILCQPYNNNIMMTKPHSYMSDWYAFSVMLMSCLLFVDPYGGVYKPKDKNKRLIHNLRPLKRITVFNQEVKYPKPAIHYSFLSDDLLQYFHLVFEKDKREVFPYNLLEETKWTKCSKCGTEHARQSCPVCYETTPPILKETVVVRGKVTATRIFQTNGIIVYSFLQNNALKWLYFEDGNFIREDGRKIIGGKLDPKMRYGIIGKSTIIAQSGQLVTLKNSGEKEKLNIDMFGNTPVFDTNNEYRFWVTGGQLLRDGKLGQEYIGDVLSGQTFFGVGKKFGFGFYRAGNLNVSFVFSTLSQGINDNVKIPSIRGQLIECNFSFSDDFVWFFVKTSEGSQTFVQCYVINSRGELIAHLKEELNDNSWMKSIYGKCSIAKFLFSATDEGIIRIEIENDKIVKTKEFPDTEPFVNANSKLYASSDGIYVVNENEIYLLKIN